MLISFSIRNFRSIYEKQELTFLASKYGSFSEGLIRNKKVEGGILPLLAIYGANAAGKSNFLRAIHFFGDAIENSHNKWKPDAKIQASPHFFHKDEPTEFECEFIFQRESYKLGFSLDQEQILKEYLFAGKKLIYRRNGNRYRLGQALKGFESTKRNTRKNSLFISAAAQNNHSLLKKIQGWFSYWMSVTDDRLPEEAFAGFLMGRDDSRPFMIQAISALNPEIINLEQGESLGSDQAIDETPDKLPIREALARWSRVNVVHQSKDGSQTARLLLKDESKGTQCYLALANSILLTLTVGGLLLLDEADQGLHPALLKSIVSLFQNPQTNPRHAQLIFNTHDTSLLVPEVMRPDQIWFVDRDSHSHSKIYCLADFEGIRSETKAQRAYLEGRFGAVPFLDNLSGVFERALDHGKKEKDA